MNKKSRQTARNKLICYFTAVWMAAAAAGITTAGFANNEPLPGSSNYFSTVCSFDTADTADTADSSINDKAYISDTRDVPVITPDEPVRSTVETPDDSAAKPTESRSADSFSSKATDKTADTDEKKSTPDNSVKISSENSESNINSKASSEKKKTESKQNNSSKNSSSDTSEKDTKKDAKQDNKKETKTQTEKPKTKQPPKQYLIDVAHINQNNSLVTGCEIVSTKMVLDYYGKKDITLDKMIKHMEMWDLKVTDKGKLYGKTPYEAFIGNPKVSSGFGCFPPVIEDMIEDFEFDDLYADDTCGLELDFLAKTYVSQDIPVLVWATIGMSESYPTYSWYGVGHKGEPNNKKYTWRAGEHCLVLVGYDEKYYSFADPLAYQKVTKYEKTLVEKRYKEIGMQSLVIRKKE